MALIQLSNSKFAFLNQGAILQEFSVAGQNIVLSLPDPNAYLSAPYFGETIGRVANRIGGGCIANLNGRRYELVTNDNGKNHHHGGEHGWGHKHFSGPQHVQRNGRDALLFTYLSPDGEEGYPGAVEVQVCYVAYEQMEGTVLKSILEIEYEARLINGGCKETVVNITNHSYFNIGDGLTIDGTELDLITSDHLDVDTNGIPTGSISVFPGVKPSKAFLLGAGEPVIDHCFVTDVDPVNLPLDTRRREPCRLVSAYHPSTSIHLEVYSTEPAFQVYTGDANNVAASAETRAYGPRSGFCVEPGRYINAINMPKWKSQVLLQSDQLYGSKIAYKAWKA